MIESGRADVLGASWDGEGVNFALYSAHASSVDLCLFDSAGRPTGRHELPEQTDRVWHGYLPRLGPGQLYGYRVHGEYAPESGLRFNPRKLVVDPYARELAGSVVWQPPVFDYVRERRHDRLQPSQEDSAPFVPKCVVHRDSPRAPIRPGIPWSEMVIYETNVRGYTMRHPDVGVLDRGTFRGMRHREVLSYLQALGVTTIELMPVHAFVDEEFLVRRGLRNFWGYNTLAFFVADDRLLGGGGAHEFREMVDAIHDMNIEVVLDVVFNHTAEGGKHGPTLSFRGIDNPSYYRLEAADRSDYVNDTGCGNTVDTEQPVVRRLIRDSLVYWATEMGIDGFRFDLATVLGRTAAGFSRDHPLFTELGAEPALSGVKLIAEPWDVGPGGYQLGGFPAGWAEWNDRYRDATRQFWRGDPGLAAELARRVHGSSDLFEASGRGPEASVNFVTSHDGFTLADCASYIERHNEANGEDNRDGHGENHTVNFGVEGPTADREIAARRRRHRLNLLATLMFSQGTPMLLGGDELGNSQAGNNNAYCQDNEIGWIDWAGLERDPTFLREVRDLLRVRAELPLLRQPAYRHGEDEAHGHADIVWFAPSGATMTHVDWVQTQSLGLLLNETETDGGAGPVHAVAVLFNAAESDCAFTLPALATAGRWTRRFATGDCVLDRGAPASVKLGARSCACLAYGD